MCLRSLMRASQTFCPYFNLLLSRGKRK
uniref:Uncharacterized protein n=1 Tax=Arundo donax TaxID=35708 RepID=A0A0A8YN14_ARUDO